MLLNDYNCDSRDELIKKMKEKNCDRPIGEAEADVYLYFKKHLSDEYMVYHDYRFDSLNNYKHQIDFLIFNKKYGYIVLEVKSDSKMKERGANDEVQEEQARKQCIGLLPILDKECNATKNRQFIDYMVLYWNVKDLNDDERKIYNDKKDRWNNKSFLQSDIKDKNLDLFFEGFFKSHMWNEHNNGYNYLEEKDGYSYFEAEERFKSLCAMRHDDIDKIDRAELVIDKLTGEQRNFFDTVASQNNIAFIDGDAGTGKTYLAMAFVEKCKKENKKVYYMLSTNKLVIFIKEKFHSLVENIKFIMYYSEDSDEVNINKFDFNYKNIVIIIDEAQDVGSDFLIKVIKKCKEYGIKLIILNSDKQNTFRNNTDKVRAEVKKAEGLCFELVHNCRNDKKIIEKLNKISNSKNRKDGIEINYVNNSDDAECRILEYINNKVRDGLDASRISILTNCKGKDFFRGKIKDTFFRKIRNVFPEIDIDTIRRNKGCENSVVIIYDNVGNLIEKEDGKDLYLALSRAKVEYKYYSIKSTNFCNVFWNNY